MAIPVSPIQRTREILVSTPDTVCLDAETLRDAKAHPEKYPDLLVRIAGFNALFAKLSPTEQDDLIARAETSEW